METEKAPEDWEKANVTPIVKQDKRRDLGNYRLVTLTPIPEKVKGQVVLKSVFKHMKDEKINVSSQHEFTKEKCQYRGPKKRNEVKKETENTVSYF